MQAIASSPLTGISAKAGVNDQSAANNNIVSLHVGGQLCGLPVQAVRDVLGPQTITRVPLASPEIAGNLNLRGRIVTTIDLRKRLGLEILDKTASAMSVVTEHGPELYALLVDRVLEVVSVAERKLSPLPPTLAAGCLMSTGFWQSCRGWLDEPPSNGHGHSDKPGKRSDQSHGL